MVEQKNGNKLRRHIAVALLPTAALLLGSNASLATNLFDDKSLSAFAIGGTGADAIGGTGVDAIGGTGRSKGRAIGGTGSDAIGGTGVQTFAIGGTGVDAIGGTGVQTFAIGGTGRDQLMLVGPIEAIDQVRGTITVLGRKLQLPAGEASSQILNSFAGGAAMHIAVLGSMSPEGKTANLRIQVLQAPYVPGVSEVVLTGMVQALDMSKGMAVINGVAVDYNALLGTRANSVRVGNVVTVRGTMPQVGQAISASVLVIHGR